jgi:ABC-type arginine/histidine transport system permease subunit
MSLMIAITSPFGICMLITIALTFPLPLLLNYTLFQSSPSFGLELVILGIFGVTYLVGHIISVSASNQRCDKHKPKVAAKKGFKQAFYSTLIYLIVFFIPFLKSPFTDIGGDNLFWNSLGEGFILGMTNIALSISNYFTSQKESCVMDKKEAAKVFAKMEKKLKSRKKKPKPKQITIIH